MQKKIIIAMLSICFLAALGWEINELLWEDRFEAVFGFKPNSREYQAEYTDEIVVKNKLLVLQKEAKDANRAYFLKYGYDADAGHPDWYKNESWQDRQVRLYDLAVIRQYESANRLRKHFGYLPRLE